MAGYVEVRWLFPVNSNLFSAVVKSLKMLKNVDGELQF